MESNLNNDELYRLTHPRFDLLETHFGCKMPTHLYKLYSNHDEIVRTGIYIDVKNFSGEQLTLYVQAYETIDEKLLGSFPGYEKYFEFALCGGPFLYMINPSMDDPEVCLFNMEDSIDAWTPLGVNLSQFVNASRRYEDEEK